MESKDLEQIVLKGLEYEKIEKEKAAERKAMTRKNGLKPEDAKCSQETTGQTRDIVANKLGVSGKHWERMKIIYLHRDCLSDAEYTGWRTGKLSTSKIYNEINQTIKCNDTLDEIWKMLDELLNDMIVYESSYIHADIQHNLLSVLWGCKENTKKEVLANFNRLVEFNKDVLDKRYDEISEMKKKIKNLKQKLQRKTYK